MAHGFDDATARTQGRRRWLAIADEVRQSAAATDSYRHAPSPHAGVEALRKLAGVIRLKGPVPLWDIFDEHEDAD